MTKKFKRIFGSINIAKKKMQYVQLKLKHYHVNTGNQKKYMFENMQKRKYFHLYLNFDPTLSRLRSSFLILFSHGLYIKGV